MAFAHSEQISQPSKREERLGKAKLAALIAAGALAAATAGYLFRSAESNPVKEAVGDSPNGKIVVPGNSGE